MRCAVLALSQDESSSLCDRGDGIERVSDDRQLVVVGVKRLAAAASQMSASSREAGKNRCQWRGKREEQLTSWICNEYLCTKAWRHEPQRLQGSTHSIGWVVKRDVPARASYGMSIPKLHDNREHTTRDYGSVDHGPDSQHH